MKYLTYYDTNNDEGRNVFLSAKNKVDYIVKKIVKIKDNVDIISASMSSSKGNFNAKKIKIADNVSLKCFKAHKENTFLRKIKSLIYRNFTLFFYLLFNVKRNERIIVYHSLGYMKILNILKKIKKFKLVLEIEEIYGDVGCNNKIIKKELKFFKKADAYIFPTILLNEKINVDDKPFAIIHGTYNVEKQVSDKFSDGRIHCVYAGTFDPRKGGAAAAAAAARYLSQNFHVHIIGFGTEEEVKLLTTTIEEIEKNTKCKITYDGLKNGDEYIKFLQSCHIGLSLQDPTAMFNNTSFPSKVLSYLANGLRVVSIKIRALETSDVNELLYYYDEQTPENIAKAISSIDVKDDFDGRSLIRKLDEKLSKEIINVL